ncbi:hypothetical protein BP6252_13800 [Coleophoma cylindrospora]|uniref:Cytochrome P450 n=1 Tax=Coleophoma cylindrospora TaxID=1849047 RepID=A0A3D8Q6K4_9HELO|nr:hypothetical protein BP6252_13800 [Coleophoma cylindrospora]
MDPIALFRAYPTIATLTTLLVSYVALGIIKRLYFSPVSRFPGPKLAAITFWYQYYYNHILRGQYTYEIERLHREYGPIVRINPHELHVDDPAFYDTLYGGPGAVRDKWEKDSVAGLRDSIFTTMPHDLHKLRRSAVAPFFSLQSARRLQPVIQRAADSVIKTLKSKQSSSSVVDATEIFAAYSNDVVMEYSFGRSENRLTSLVVDSNYFSESVKAGASAQGLKYFPWFTRLMFAMPESVLARDPGFANFANLRNDMIRQVEHTINKTDRDFDNSTNPTIFHEILNSKLPDAEKNPLRLAGEAVVLIGAGTITTAWNITVAAYYLVSHPAVLLKLKQELEAAIPERETDAQLSTLEQLPYLTGVIKETLRLSNSVTGPNPRIAPLEALQYREWTIPAGTPVSMSARDIHYDEKVFPDARAFKPERWVEDPKLNRFLVAFSKGSRACLGQNLALAEMYVILAGIFRRFGSVDVRRPGDVGALQLFETDFSDVDVVGHVFLPLVKEDSKGVRFMVLN